MGNTVSACDLCGCGVGNYYLGVMPQFQKNFIGLRYRYSAFDSHLNGTSEYSSLFQTQERFYTTELWARIYPSPKWQILAFVPYQFNFQDEQNQTKTLSGLADISVLAQYELVNTTRDSINQLFEHSLFVGGGVKLPTGRYNFDETNQNQVANANFQLGSGSTDFLWTLQYTIRYKKAGLTSDISYKVNTSNSNAYRFGNRISTNLNVFYIKQLGKVGLMPLVGTYYEHSQKDIRVSKKVNDTGGYLLASSFGLQAFTNRLMFGATYQMSFKQSLANQNVRALNRVIVQAAILF